MAISIKSIFIFGPLLSLQAVQSLGKTPQLELLKILQNQSFKDFKALVKKNPDLLKELKISDTEAYSKIRILALSKVASSNIGKFIQYEDIVSALDINLDQVEFWVIDGNFYLFANVKILGIRSRLIDAKLDPLNNTIFIRYPILLMAFY